MMSALTKLRIIPRFTQFYRGFALQNSADSPWLRDNAPGPYPKTEEEKIAAAKKYGLFREEYEPFPDDGDGFGDYPKVKPVNVDQKDPYQIWTDPHFRRNWGDPIPVEFLMYTVPRIKHYRSKHSPLFYWAGFFLVPITTFLLIYTLADYKVHHDTLEKQYYTPGVAHYTFDLEGDETKPKEHH